MSWLRLMLALVLALAVSQLGGCAGAGTVKPAARCVAERLKSQCLPLCAACTAQAVQDCLAAKEETAACATQKRREDSGAD